MPKLLAIQILAFILAGRNAIGQTTPISGPPHDPKPSDCLNDEKGIRPPKTPNNAAWEYFRLWDSLPKEEFDAISSHGNVPYLQNDPVRLAPLQRELCLKHQDYIEGLMRAAAMPVCDWGVQHQYGEEFRLPHFKFLRDSYRALFLDLHRCMEDHSAQGTADRLAAVLRMSNQSRTDRTLISSLVGATMFQGAANQVGDLIKEPWCTPASARVVLIACQSIQQDDLFGFVSGMQEERWQATQWPHQRFRGNAAGAEYYTVMDDSSGFYTLYPGAFLIGMGEQQLFADLDRFDKYLAITLPLWKSPDNDLRLRELEVEALEGQYGVAASCQAESIELGRRNMNRARRLLQKLINDLSAFVVRAEGERK